MTIKLELVSADDILNEPCNEEEYTKSLFDAVINYFQKNNPSPTTELKYRNGYELLVATILSARCPDKRVNMVTPHTQLLISSQKLLQRMFFNI